MMYRPGRALLRSSAPSVSHRYRLPVSYHARSEGSSYGTSLSQTGSSPSALPSHSASCLLPARQEGEASAPSQARGRSPAFSAVRKEDLTQDSQHSLPAQIPSGAPSLSHSSLFPLSDIREALRSLRSSNSDACCGVILLHYPEHSAC